jgi:cell pole-organizing protein PopZ
MSASQTPGAGGASAPANDPSMEDILASIRRILSEEEPAAQPPGPPAAAEPEAAEEKADDVLVLDPSMLVDEEAAPAPPPLAEPEPPPAPFAPPPPFAAPSPLPPLEVVTPSPTLLAPETAAAATSSVGNLMRTLATERTMQVHRDGPTIEDIVREELRPLLKQWLDTNLPDLVERLVRTEIERVVRRAVP